MKCSCRRSGNGPTQDTNLHAPPGSQAFLDHLEPTDAPMRVATIVCDFGRPRCLGGYSYQHRTGIRPIAECQAQGGNRRPLVKRDPLYVKLTGAKRHCLLKLAFVGLRCTWPNPHQSLNRYRMWVLESSLAGSVWHRELALELVWWANL